MWDFIRELVHEEQIRNPTFKHYEIELAKVYPMVRLAIQNGYYIESLEPFVMSRFDSVGSLL